MLGARVVLMQWVVLCLCLGHKKGMERGTLGATTDTSAWSCFHHLAPHNSSWAFTERHPGGNHGCIGPARSRFHLLLLPWKNYLKKWTWKLWLRRVIRQRPLRCSRGRAIHCKRRSPQAHLIIRQPWSIIISYSSFGPFQKIQGLWWIYTRSWVKVNFLARCGQKSDLSGLCGIGYWVWIISTAHCKQPILVGY